MTWLILRLVESLVLGLITATRYLLVSPPWTSINFSAYKTHWRMLCYVKASTTIFHQRSLNYNGYQSSSEFHIKSQLLCSTLSEKISHPTWIIFCVIMNNLIVWTFKSQLKTIVFKQAFIDCQGIKLKVVLVYLPHGECGSVSLYWGPGTYALGQGAKLSWSWRHFIILILASYIFEVNLTHEFIIIGVFVVPCINIIKNLKWIESYWKPLWLKYTCLK